MSEKVREVSDKEIIEEMLEDKSLVCTKVQEEEAVLDNTLDRTLSESSTDQSRIHRIHEVEPIKPELLNVDDADKLFQKAAEIYQPFVKMNHDFKVAVLQFESSINPNKSSPDFEKCLEQYHELLSKENRSSLLPSIVEGASTLPDSRVNGKIKVLVLRFFSITNSGSNLHMRFFSIYGSIRDHHFTKPTLITPRNYITMNTRMVLIF